MNRASKELKSVECTSYSSISFFFPLCEHKQARCKLVPHSFVYKPIFVGMYLSQFMCRILQTFVSQNLVSFSQNYHISALSFVIFLVFKAINVPFISEAEPDRGTGFRDTLLVFALKLRSVSVPSCSVTSEKKSSKLTLQVCRAPSSVICISGRKISRKNSKACSCLQL